MALQFKEMEEEANSAWKGNSFHKTNRNTRKKSLEKSMAWVCNFKVGSCKEVIEKRGGTVFIPPLFFSLFLSGPINSLHSP